MHSGGAEQGKRVKYSVAMVIRDAEDRFIAVKRADDDESLAGVWGLPAATRRNGETDEGAVLRAGREKLGVAVKVLRLVGTDRIERQSYTLQLSDYEVAIVSGAPMVPQPDKTVSQYTALQYTKDLDLLVEAAQRGSLCSRIFLDSENYSWRG
jgi:8-oxo-dGTP diphosphatase